MTLLVVNGKGEIMTEEVKQESEFAKKYHAEKALKRTKKKVKKDLQKKGFDRNEANKMVKGIVNRATKSVIQRHAGRGG